MIRTIIWFIWFWVSLLLTMPTFLYVKIIDKQNKVEKRIKLVHKTTKLWAKSLLWVSGSKIVVEGEENIPEGPVLYVSNHQSNFDIPIFISYVDRPKAFIAKAEIAKMPMLVSWMRQMRCVFMDRKDIRQSVEAISKGIKHIKEGYSMVIFPEGTRSSNGEVQEFKAGSFRLALKSGVPVVPVVISGSNKIMGKGSFIIKPAQVKVKILEPIYTSNLTKEEGKDIAVRVEELIKRNL